MSLVQPIRLRVLPKLIPLDGKSVEMRSTDTVIQWRGVGDPSWIDLIPLADIKGEPGPPGVIQSLVPGENVSIDDTDPQNPVIAFTGAGTGDVLAANNLSDLDDAETARENIGAEAEYITPDFTGAIPVLLRLISQDHVKAEWFGPIGGTTDDAVFVKAATAAVEDNKPFKIDRDHTLDTVDLSGVAAGGSLRIQHTGLLTHVATASDHMFAFGTRDYLEVIGPGTFDGNKDNQTANRLIMPVDYIDKFYLRGANFNNLKFGAVHMRNVNMSRFVMEQFTCLDGALHNGVLNGQYCYFVMIQGGKHVRISDFSMVQTANPTTGQCRNPAGIFHINTSPSGVVGQTFIVERGFLDNLGHNVAGNLVGVVDLYSRCENVQIRGLRIRRPRFIPIRTNYASKIEVTGNDILVSSQMIVDGGASYSDASAISCVTVNRGYATDFGGVNALSIETNSIRMENNHDCRGISVMNTDPASLMRSVKISNNPIVHTGTNASRGLLLYGTSSVEDDANDIQGFSIARQIEGTSTGGTATAAFNPAKYSVTRGMSMGGSNGVFARTAVTNLDVTIDDHVFSGQSSSSYTIRNAKNVRVQKSTMPNPGDTSANVAFWFNDNNAGGGTDPAGYNSNTYYRLRNNVGRADQSSP